jgi:protein-tyrosine phosphatase
MDPAPRAIALHGASNFRDLGGYWTADGRRVRLGRVYRSDHLAGLTPADLGVLQALSLRASIDFRGTKEAAATPYQIPGATRLALPIEPTVVQSVRRLLDSGHVPDVAETVGLMCDTYRGFVQQQGSVFGHFLRHLLQHPQPTVFHCTAGKDRTGFAAALLLSVLGVARTTIMEDYLLSNTLYRRDPLNPTEGPAHVVDVLWQVQPAFLQAALDCVDRDFGGLPRYLTTMAGIDSYTQQQLRSTLLENDGD